MQDYSLQQPLNTIFGEANEKLDQVIYALISELDKEICDQKPKAQLTQEEEEKLRDYFKAAGMGKSTADSWMVQLCEAVGLDPEISIVPLQFKERSRAEHKMLAILSGENRDLNDIVRGRILINSPEELAEILHLLRVMERKQKANEKYQGVVPGINLKKVRVLNGEYDNYFAKQRSSGYCSALHIDLDIGLKHNKGTKIEIQIMPKDFEEVYDQSHILFEMIRILEENQESLNNPELVEERKKVLDILREVNHALYNEHTIRTEFMHFRKGGYTTPDRETMQNGHDILDRIRTAIERLHRPSPTHEQRNSDWPDLCKQIEKTRKVVANTMTFMKTTLSTMYKHGVDRGDHPRVQEAAPS